MEILMSKAWNRQIRGPSHWELAEGKMGQPEGVEGPQDMDKDTGLPLRKPSVACRLNGFPAV